VLGEKKARFLLACNSHEAKAKKQNESRRLGLLLIRPLPLYLTLMRALVRFVGWTWTKDSNKEAKEKNEEEAKASTQNSPLCVCVCMHVCVCESVYACVCM